MTDFDYECMQRKRLAQQARHRICGSKSKKCNLSTDNMTQKQWKERNGVVMSVSLNQKISWNDFKALSPSMQGDYLNHMIDTYGANSKDLAGMFNINASTLRRHVHINDLQVQFSHRKVMKPQEKEAWDEMLEGIRNAPVVAGLDEENEVKYETLEDTESSRMQMDSFSLQFSGKIDLHMIYNSLLHILGENSSGKVEIICNLD